MHLVRSGAPGAQRILDKICPGKAPRDPMGEVATYLAEQIKVKIQSFFETLPFILDFHP